MFEGCVTLQELLWDLLLVVGWFWVLAECLVGMLGLSGG